MVSFLNRYKKKGDRGPLHEAMRMLLPMCYERMVHLIPDPSEHSTLLQKLILKIFYAMTQVGHQDFQLVVSLVA